MKAEIAFVILTVLLASMLASSVNLAQSDSALASDLNALIINTNFQDDPAFLSVGTEYGIIFGKLQPSVIDSAALSLQSAQKWNDIFLLKRCAELGGYTSTALETALVDALNNIPMMDNGLPVTFDREGNLTYSGFLIYHGFTLYGCKWAAERGITRWNATKMVNAIITAYNRDPVEGILCVEESSTLTMDSRYYDEQAEVARCLDILNHVGGTNSFGSSIWNRLCTYNEVAHDDDSFSHGNYKRGKDFWWSPNGYFFYRPYWRIWECEVGGFALVWSDYFGSPPSQVLSDVNSKLLKLGWGSGLWNNHLIIHAYSGQQCPDSNSGTLGIEWKPLETVASWRALHSLHPYMNATMKSNLMNMQEGTDGTTAAQYYVHNDGFSDNIQQRCMGIMATFLSAIIPVEGCLDLGFFEEGYVTNHEYSFNKFQFDYAQNRIRIPLKQGGLMKFAFGSSIASYTFSKSGIWDVFFSNDWNTVSSVSEVTSQETNIEAHVTKDGVDLSGAMVRIRIQERTDQGITDSGGKWVFTNIPLGTYTVTASAAGLSDISNTITISSQVETKHCDLPFVTIQYLILHFNTNPSSPNWDIIADVNQDGTVNMRDINKLILGFNMKAHPQGE